MIVILFIDFSMSDSNDRAISIRQISYIKSLFVSMFHHIWNLKYFKHLRIINYIGLEPFIHVINLDVVLSSNVFITLVYAFKCNVLLF